MRTVLVIRFSSIGDVVLTNPVYKAIKDRDPSVRLVAVVRRGYERLVKANPYADLAMVYNPPRESLAGFIRRLRRLNPDTVIDLHDNPRSRMIRSRLGAASVLVYRKHTLKRLLLVLLKINLLKDSKRVIERYLETALPETAGRKGRVANFFRIPDAVGLRIRRTHLRSVRPGFVAVCKEANWSTKRWPHYNELIDVLVRGKGERVVLLGEKPDHSLRELQRAFPGRLINLTGRLDILGSAAVIGLSRILITNDTGLMHIADAMRKKTLSIWGPTVFEFGFKPVNAAVKVISNGKISCRPCSLHGSAKCPLGHFRCMSTIDPLKIAGLAVKR
jgi:ADP-heptose:LPS heptosyltransferase